MRQRRIVDVAAMHSESGSAASSVDELISSGQERVLVPAGACANVTKPGRRPFGASGEDESVERVMGIEPTLEAWEAPVLPLNYTRANVVLHAAAAICCHRS
jgi:hypothetical protein